MTYPDDAMTPLARETQLDRYSTKGVFGQAGPASAPRLGGLALSKARARPRARRRRLCPPHATFIKLKGTYSVHFARQSGTLTTM